MGRIISNIKRFLCEVFVERSMAVQIFWIQCQIALYIKFCLCVTHNEMCKWPWTNFLTRRWRLENLSLKSCPRWHIFLPFVQLGYNFPRKVPLDTWCAVIRHLEQFSKIYVKLAIKPMHLRLPFETDLVHTIL